jgi:hypothetical protein
LLIILSFGSRNLTEVALSTPEAEDNALSQAMRDLLPIKACARFSTCPMQVHEIAIHRICRYLQATAHKGYILHPTLCHRNLDCYVNANFVGLWNEASSSESTSVESHTGYVIFLC